MLFRRFLVGNESDGVALAEVIGRVPAAMGLGQAFRRSDFESAREAKPGSAAVGVAAPDKSYAMVPGTALDAPDEPLGSIAAGGTVTAQVGAAGDIDYFNLNVVAGQTYSVSLRGSGSTPLMDTQLSVSTSAGATLTDDDGGQGSFSLLTFTATATGTYQIAAAAFPNSGLTGQYTLDVRQMASDSVSSSFGSAKAVAVGSTTFGFLEASGDVDMFAVTLNAGSAYTFEVAGGADYNTDPYAVRAGELDTRMVVYDAAGRVVASNDDISFPDDVSSGLRFTPTTAGTYYIKVDAYSGQTGGFTLNVDVASPSSGDGATQPSTNPMDSIDWGTQLSSNNVSVYFAKAGESFDGVTSLGWSTYEISRAMAALQTWADVTDLTFSIAADPTGATFKLVTTSSTEFLGYFNPPGTPSAGVGVFATNGQGWDTSGGLEQGGFGWVTLVHEFGHGLGLAHPHDDGGTSTIMSGVTAPFGSYGVFNLNQGVYTTMSYNDGWQLHPSGGGSALTYGHQGGPGALDIAVVQQKYGADLGRNSGDSVYTLPSVNAPGTFWSTIWDTGGIDTIVHAGAAASLIDLTAATIDYSATGAGVISYVSGIYGGFTIANGVVIENATGGTGADTLVGNSAANRLEGRDGNDVLLGRDGLDTLNGGVGNDKLDGGIGADVMSGGAGDDTYEVNETGDQVIEVSATDGADTVRSAISYVLPNYVEALVLTGTVALNGSGNQLANNLTGNAAANTLDGGAGADTMTGGAGNDTYVFDNSGDRAVESSSTGGIDLVRSSVTTTLGTNVENLALTGTSSIAGTGNAHSNNIVGNAAANTLSGLGGADTLDGGGGNDKLFGGAGNDTLKGGTGSDAFVYDATLSSSSNVDRVTDFSTVDDTIWLDQTVFTKLTTTGTLAASAFHVGTAAHDLDDRIIYDNATGKLYYDPDGTGSAAKVLFAQLTTGLSLTNSDFFVIA